MPPFDCKNINCEWYERCKSYNNDEQDLEGPECLVREMVDEKPAAKSHMPLNYQLAILPSYWSF